MANHSKQQIEGVREPGQLNMRLHIYKGSENKNNMILTNEENESMGSHEAYTTQHILQTMLYVGKHLTARGT
jgi:hypothetical protein